MFVYFLFKKYIFEKYFSSVPENCLGFFPLNCHFLKFCEVMRLSNQEAIDLYAAVVNEDKFRIRIGRLVRSL